VAVNDGKGRCGDAAPLVVNFCACLPVRRRQRDFHRPLSAFLAECFSFGEINDEARDVARSRRRSSPESWLLRWRVCSQRSNQSFLAHSLFHLGNLTMKKPDAKPRASCGVNRFASTLGGEKFNHQGTKEEEYVLSRVGFREEKPQIKIMRRSAETPLRLASCHSSLTRQPTLLNAKAFC